MFSPLSHKDVVEKFRIKERPDKPRDDGVGARDDGEGAEQRVGTQDNGANNYYEKNKALTKS